VISLQTKKLTKKTTGHCDIIDITPRIHDAIKKDHSHHGIITVFVSRSTVALTTIEHQSGLIQDSKEFVERLIPSDRRYHHDDRWGRQRFFAPPGRLFRPSIAIPIDKAKPLWELGSK
jgi:thiamine phosphate synthase YjbQ (UPF0047 family)